jgi:hypothetical protein
MHLPDNADIQAHYLSFAPATTAQFFRLNPELQGPVSGLCSLLGHCFPGSQVSMTAVYNFEDADLKLVIGLSEPLNESTAGVVSELMTEYLNPIVERMGLGGKVMVALGAGLGEHSSRYNTTAPLEAMARMEESFDELGLKGPLGTLLATSLPLYEKGCGNDLERVFRAANPETDVSKN